MILEPRISLDGTFQVEGRVISECSLAEYGAMPMNDVMTLAAEPATNCSNPSPMHGDALQHPHPGDGGCAAQLVMRGFTDSSASGSRRNARTVVSGKILQVGESELGQAHDI